MFTGIVSQIGTVVELQKHDKEILLQIRPSFSSDQVLLGESISVNGVCLTATNSENGTSETCVNFFISQETFERTNLKNLTVGGFVNLERALRLSDRLSGHLVQGHVDGLARLTKINQAGEQGHVLEFSVPVSLQKYLITKGSVCLNGMSLTVNSIVDSTISIMIIPHTWKNTTLQYSKVGDDFNIEADMVAKYLFKWSNQNARLN